MGLLYVCSLIARTLSPVHERMHTVQGAHCAGCTLCKAGHLQPSLLPQAPAGPTALSSILPASCSLVHPYPSHLLISQLNTRRQRGSHGRREMNEPGRLQRLREFSCGRKELLALDPDLS